MAAPKTLSRACAPLFLYLATFRRNAATSKVSIADLQAALMREIDKVRTTCDRDARLSSQFERVYYALVASADQVVLSSAWPQRAGWSMSLLETQLFGSAEGGREFYKFVDEVLNDPSEEAVHAATVLFHCMALGFQGELMGERKELERRRRQLYEKARLAGALGDQLTPGAYGQNATRKLQRMPSVGILRLVGVALAAGILAYLFVSLATSHVTADDREDIDRIVDNLSTGAPRPGSQNEGADVE